MAKRSLAQLMREDNFMPVNLGGFFGSSSLPMIGGLPGPVTSSFDVGGAVSSVGTAGCGAIKNPVARQLCLATVGVVGGALNKSTPKSGNIDPSRVTTYSGGLAPQQVDPCPPGSIKIGSKCVAPGDIYPGGDPFIFGAGGQVSMGAMGMPAVTPAQMQQTTLRCPRRYVLAVDNLCYPKGFIPRSLRKWAPEAKPMVSAMDAKVVRRAKAVQKRIRKAQTTLAPRATRCAKRGKK